MKGIGEMSQADVDFLKDNIKTGLAAIPVTVHS